MSRDVVQNTVTSLSASGGRHLASLIHSFTRLLGPAAYGASPSAIHDHNRIRWLLIGSLTVAGIFSTNSIINLFFYTNSKQSSTSSKSNHSTGAKQHPQNSQLAKNELMMESVDVLQTECLSDNTQSFVPQSRHSSNRLSCVLVPDISPDSIFIQKIVDFLIRPNNTNFDINCSTDLHISDYLFQQQSKPPSLSLPLFQAQQDHLINEIKSAKRPRHPLLVEGGPGIGKGASLHTFVQSQSQLRPAFYLKLDNVLSKLGVHQSFDTFQHLQTDLCNDSFSDQTVLASNTDIEQPEMSNSCYIAESWRSAIETIFGLDYLRQEQLYDANGDPLNMLSASFDHITEALRLIRAKSRYGPTLLVIDNLELLFNGLPGYDKRLRYRSVESVDDLDVIDYLLDQVNPTISKDRQFTEETAYKFVETFEGNLTELYQYCRSTLSVSEFIAQREDSFLQYLKEHIPTNPHTQKHNSLNPYAPPVKEDADFKDIILEMIMRNGVISLAMMDSERLNLIEVLVEKNFLRWRDARIRRRHQDRAMGLKVRRIRASSIASTSIDIASEVSGETMETNVDGSSEWKPRPLSGVYEQDMLLLEQQMDDPFAFLRRGDTELVWYNRLVGNVCERWFNENAW
ncbi:hypothetical protein BATDEDRAFT_88124 [Batrachochytrium dendrobatidis JAM81]|uniref:Uncharacterized protein n=1 Tax=Batrachochytrium dendrobatidis (strain JAM81 / FGSC 10211) TaxID=684364 RepID=F4P257_BATDJ|nr:uncharacterized protein BATDEDRAFT_88124 [Batrachochytrium dendrobatidis JAM81]EGF80798.1 hypothetical protein BATDEDRAFT_88124 [Batrachochytrium dendrobatidis JAM81]|eukprot:XP_006678703.1 hypothetical protein BATDEDRAFT_88124 [Batrachochytrium dendrobatidis JAM81]